MSNGWRASTTGRKPPSASRASSASSGGQWSCRTHASGSACQGIPAGVSADSSSAAQSVFRSRRSHMLPERGELRIAIRVPIMRGG
jgi:hypothetical protein